MRKCKLINFKTKKSFSAKSIVEFCRISGLDKIDKNAKFHLSCILNGDRFSHFGWCLPKYFNLRVKVKDLYGNVYNERIIDYYKKYNIRIQRVWSLYKRHKDIIGGLSLYETKIKCIPPRNFKIVNYEILTPNKKIVKGNTLTAVSKQIGITRRSLFSLKEGRSSSVRGYSIKSIKIKKRSILK